MYASKFRSLPLPRNAVRPLPFRCNDDRDLSAHFPWLQLVLRGTVMISLFMMSRPTLNEPLCDGVHRVKNTAFKTAVRGSLEVERSGCVFQMLSGGIQ